MYNLIVRQPSDEKLILIKALRYFDKSRVLYHSRFDDEIPSDLQAELDVDTAAREAIEDDDEIKRVAKINRRVAIKEKLKNGNASLPEIQEILAELI